MVEPPNLAVIYSTWCHTYPGGRRGYKRVILCRHRRLNAGYQCRLCHIMLRTSLFCPLFIFLLLHIFRYFSSSLHIPRFTCMQNPQIIEIGATGKSLKSSGRLEHFTLFPQAVNMYDVVIWITSSCGQFYNLYL